MVSEIPEAVFSTLEKNLEQNETQFRQLINALPDLLYSYSLKQGGIFYSPGVLKTLGHTPDYLLEHPSYWKESIHPDDQPIVDSAVRDFLLGKHFNLVYRIRHAGGHWVWLRDRSVNSYEQDDDFIIQGIASDITAEKQQRQQEEQYLAMLSCISDVVAVVDCNGTITFISPSVTTRFGWLTDDLLQTRGWDLVHPDDLASAMARFFELLDQGEQAHDSIEIRIRCKDKRYRPVRLSGSNRLQNPDIQGILLSFCDLSAEKQAITELNKARSLAEEANRLKNSFLASIGHELRTPMNSVICMTQTLRFELLSADQQTAIDLIEHAINHLEELATDITNLARLEEGNLQLERNEFSLCRLFNDLHASRMPKIQEHNITLRTSIAADTPDRLAGDLLRIKLILQNLLSNAIACNEAGTITIAASSHQTDCQTVSVIFSVQDHRPALTPDELASVFEPFQAAARPGKQGTGLGLTISKRLAEMMGGTLRAENGSDGSTCFILQIPLEVCSETCMDQGKKSQ